MRVGVWLGVLGLGIAGVGVVRLVAPRAFAWFGRLPGDIRVEGTHGRVYVPLGSMLVVSVALTGIVNLVGWILSRWR